MYLLLAQVGVALILLRLIWLPVYNLTLHRLRGFPGPLLWRATRLTWIYYARRGTLHSKLRDLHETYGPVVRIAPNELSFTDAAAWKDIYGHRVGPHGNQDENEKWIVAYAGSKKATRGLLSAPRAEHSYLRRLLSHGFSDRSLRAQEETIRKYVDVLIKRLREESNGGQKSVDMNLWYGCTTFDIIGDLGFAASFDTLQKPDVRHWSSSFNDYNNPAAARAAIEATTRRMMLPDSVCDFINNNLTNSVLNNDFSKYVVETISARAKYTVERPDLIEGLIRSIEKDAIPTATIMRTATLLLGAGFETTASLLTAVTYLLCRNPSCLEKATSEVRSSFKSAEDITFATADNLPYMIACLNEGLRWYPPVATGMQRFSMEGGTTIAGTFVPEETVMSVPHWAAYHSSRNFVRADEYHPERWLGDPEFASDNLDVVQPFSAGPRNCIGRNLAMAEMRTILALILFNFDVRLTPGSQDWAQRQKSYTLWLRPPMEVYLTPVQA